MSFFDPHAELLIYDRLRPHWSQAGAIVFVTFRTHDSIPKEVVERWNRERSEWLSLHGINVSGNWSAAVTLLSEELRTKFNRRFERCREEYLDTCHGKCLLKRPELAKIVADALLYFDGNRYDIGDFVVMPHHVHLLASFPNPEAMTKQFGSWLHYTAWRINRVIGQKGHFWQQEAFDHLVRSLEQYEYLRKYIADNPQKAKLRASEYLHHTGRCCLIHKEEHCRCSHREQEHWR